MKKIELLSPAKDLNCVVAAVNSGADAVYMGASKFGARSAAGNSQKDIEAAARYAHRFNARLYITLNTILFDHELPEALEIARQSYDAGADALIIQDYGLLELDLPPLPLFASTQMHNHPAEKIKFLEGIGFRRAILARELSLDQIKEIKSHTDIDLECFVHGALCVSYSGRCFMSYAGGGRSGNRGECAQPCRMTYDLLNKEGKVLMKDRHLLSLKDLCLSNALPELIDAGITSFKIEGRLKDDDYIKNVVGYYRQKLDKILEGKGLCKASSGKSRTGFVPNPSKTFNRGYTDYFIHGRQTGIASLYTQKSIGEKLGTVLKKSADYFVLDIDAESGTTDPAVPGNGVCFFSPDGVLAGMTVELTDGNKIYPRDNRWIFEGAVVYRNHNQRFEKLLKSAKIERKIAVQLLFGETDNGYFLEALDEDGNRTRAAMEMQKTTADNPALAESTIKKQLEKLGGTISAAVN